ncbi:MAG: immunity protein YezG family protein [Clostridia bacterium]
MLNTAKIREIYAKIQSQLFYMIPERWDQILLYASVIEQVNHLQTGEMFFYYYPKGLLKRNPINVYEVPSKFNVKEEAYLQLADHLYDTIKLLREEFEKANERVWTNFTLVIADGKFHIEYAYEDLIGSKYSSYDRHIIWKCKYLDFPIERLSKKDRKMVWEYLQEERFKNPEVQSITERIYQKNIHNSISYDKNEIPQIQNVETEPSISLEKRKVLNTQRVDSYELYKQKQAPVYGQYRKQKKEDKYVKVDQKVDDKYLAYKREKERQKEEIDEEGQKNQILNFLKEEHCNKG